MIRGPWRKLLREIRYIEKEIRSLSNRIHRLGKYVLQTPKTPALPKNDRRIRLLISLGFEIVMWVLAHGHGKTCIYKFLSVQEFNLSACALGKLQAFKVRIQI